MSLKELLGEELYNQVIEKVGDNKIAIVSDGNWFPKDKFDAKNQEVKDLQGQLKDRDKQLDALKDVDPDKLKQEIADLQDANEQTKNDYEAQLQQQAKDFAVDNYLRDAKARNPKAVKALIDVEAITYKDGKLIGIDDQVKPLQETDDYLFQSDEGGNDPQIVTGGNATGGNPTRNPFTKEHWNLTEQGKLLKDNPELYKQMKSQAGK